LSFIKPPRVLSAADSDPPVGMWSTRHGATSTPAARGFQQSDERVDAWRMIQRRTADLGIRIRVGCHTFRATGITAYLEAGRTLENAQAMAAHESPRTTKLYDRTGDEITLDEVERITI
jgi:integrase